MFERQKTASLETIVERLEILDQPGGEEKLEAMFAAEDRFTRRQVLSGGLLGILYVATMIMDVRDSARRRTFINKLEKEKKIHQERSQYTNPASRVRR